MTVCWWTLCTFLSWLRWSSEQSHHVKINLSTRVVLITHSVGGHLAASCLLFNEEEPVSVTTSLSTLPSWRVKAEPAGWLRYKRLHHHRLWWLISNCSQTWTPDGLLTWRQEDVGVLLMPPPGVQACRCYRPLWPRISKKLMFTDFKIMDKKLDLDDLSVWFCSVCSRCSLHSEGE